MPIYICPRCGYDSNIKTYLRKHFTRNKPCKPTIANVSIEECFKDILGEKYNSPVKSNNLTDSEKIVNKSLISEKSTKSNKKIVNNSLISPKSVNFSLISEDCNKKIVNNSLISPKSVNFSLTLEKNVNKSLTLEKNVNKSLTLKNQTCINEFDKFKCLYCGDMLPSINILNTHLLKNCNKFDNCNNFYKYDISTFGCNMYGKGAGELYCIQLRYDCNNIYRIGLTSNLYNKMRYYRTNNIIEPKLHFYYPVNNLKNTYNILKNKLRKYNIQKDEYGIELPVLYELIIQLLGEIQCVSRKVIPAYKTSENIKCNYCLKKFKYYEELFDHFIYCENYQDSLITNNIYKCRLCKQLFNNRYDKNLHMKECADVSVPESCNIINNKSSVLVNTDKDSYTRQEMQIVNRELEHKEKEISNKDNEIAELRKQVELLILSNSNPLPNIQGDAVINNIYNFNLNKFGEEETEYITGNLIKSIMDQGAMYAAPILLKEIHFNPDHSENHNIYIPNRKQPHARIWDGDKWRLTNKKVAIEDMATKALNMMGNESSKTNQIGSVIDQYFSKDKKTVNRIHSDTELMILNEGALVNKPPSIK